ncbi:hypothetical protein [Cryobacterium sp. TMT2-42-4]|nr:hypothetical protein [Cryobacterium sp. TMT2-42-4]
MAEFVAVVEDKRSRRLDDRHLGRWRTGRLRSTAMSALLAGL